MDGWLPAPAEILHESGETPTNALIGVAQPVEHYMMVAYRTLRAMALTERLGRRAELNLVGVVDATTSASGPTRDAIMSLRLASSDNTAWDRIPAANR